MQYAQSKAWMTVLNRLHKMAVEMIVPGYGQVAAREATYPLPEEVWQTRAVVRRSYRAGRTKSDTSRLIVPQLVDALAYVRRPIAHQGRSRTAMTACTTSIALQIGPGEGEGSQEAVGHDGQLCPVATEPRPHLVAA